MPTINTELPYANMFRTVRGHGPDIDTLLAFVQERRSNPQESLELDRFFLTEFRRAQKDMEEARKRHAKIEAKHAELGALIEKMSSPPLHEAILVELHSESDRTLAKVAHGGTRRLVELHHEIDPERLRPGDVVFLSSELSVLLKPSRNEARATGEIATVERTVSPHRVVIRDRDTEVVIDAAVALHDLVLKPGDQVLWSRDVMMALEVVAPSDTTPAFVNIEDLTGDEPQLLGGLDAKLERIVALFTQSFVSPELAAAYDVAAQNKSLLLVGPPGCGKTSIARQVAQLVGKIVGKHCRFANINGSELESPWVGETQRNVRELFRALNEHDGPTILYIDEAESIGRHRGQSVGHHSDKFLSQWLTSLDGFKRRDGVAVIASTNRKDLIDGALLERISGMEVTIPRPSMDAAREILDIYLPDSLPYRTNGAPAPTARRAVIDRALSRLYAPNGGSELAVIRFRDGTNRTVSTRHLASGRLFEQICVSARQRAFERHSRTGESGVTVNDMEEAVADAVQKLTTTLSVRNIRHLLDGLPQDVDAVAIDPVTRGVRKHRYLATETST